MHGRQCQEQARTVMGVIGQIIMRVPGIRAVAAMCGTAGLPRRMMIRDGGNAVLQAAGIVPAARHVGCDKQSGQKGQKDRET